MTKQKEPGGNSSNHTPGGNFLPIFETVYKKHPYIAIFLAMLMLSLPYWPKMIVSVVREFWHVDKFADAHQYPLEIAASPSIYQPLSTQIHGKIIGPSNNERVPFAPLWQGTVDNLPEDRELYLSIENAKHELYMYKTHGLNGRFNFPHRLGNKYEGVGQEFYVRDRTSVV